MEHLKQLNVKLEGEAVENTRKIEIYQAKNVELKDAKEELTKVSDQAKVVAEGLQKKIAHLEKKITQSESESQKTALGFSLFLM